MRLTVTDLVGKPGTSRTLVRSLSRADVTGQETAADAASDATSWGPADDTLVWPVEVDLKLESVVEGILVRGDVDFTADLPCARCLETLRQEHTSTVTEMYRPPDDPEAEEGYEIVDGVIDLEILLRDAIVMDLPVRVLCREDCAGLCAVCGADRSGADCGHEATPTTDPRWAKLSELELPSAN